MDPQRRGRDTTLEMSAIRLVEALAKLAEHPPGVTPAITYFEASPSKDVECGARWIELNDSIALVKRVLADRKASEGSTNDGGSEHG
jgi:hypothetical protein